MQRFVIVGGGIAATQAAETLRERRPNDEITLVAEEPEPFYIRPLLADYVAGRIPERDLWRDFGAVAQAKGIEVVTGQAVTAVSRRERTVKLGSGAGGELLPYDTLLMATGVRPVLPRIPGTDLAGVATLSTYDDAQKLASLAAKAKKAVVVGRGLQGVEMTRALRLRGLEVTMVVPDESPWFLALFQIEPDTMEGALRQHGVQIVALDEPVELLGEGGRVRAVRTREGRELAADLVGFAVQQEPRKDLLVGLGISLAEGVVTDMRLKSSDHRVYAAGDVAQVEKDDLTRLPIGYGWMRARSHGEVAGRNMAGEDVRVETGDETEAQALYGRSLLARWK
jgi:NAD(P)H-nitrite reductase large subunit